MSLEPISKLIASLFTLESLQQISLILPLSVRGEIENRKGPVDLFAAERVHTVYMRPGENSRVRA